MGAIPQIGVCPTCRIHDRIVRVIAANWNKRTVAIKDETLLPVPTIEWDVWTTHATRCRMQLLSKAYRLGLVSWINRYELSNL